MQLSFGFDDAGPSLLARLWDRLGRERRRFSGPGVLEGSLDPVSQLIYSSIAARTFDAVSWTAFERLKARYPSWDHLADSRAAEVLACIGKVTHAEEKAPRLLAALRSIRSQVGSLSLDNLKAWPDEWCVNWLTRLSGVGEQVAAAILNFSLLRRPILVVDTHVWRIARRLGLAPVHADPRGVRLSIMAAAPAAWTGSDYFVLHWALKRLAQERCHHDKPDCAACPLADLCAKTPV